MRKVRRELESGKSDERSRAPRAGLSIDLLGDQDFVALMRMKRGAEAFGIFAAALVAGRERYQRGRAVQLSDADSLVINDRLAHVCDLIHVSRARLDAALETLAAVAREMDSQPWMYVDGEQHLVIRSFFKFNVPAGWGGARPGAGRPPRNQGARADRIQDDSRANQVDCVESATGNQDDSPPIPIALAVAVPTACVDREDAHTRETTPPNPTPETPPEWAALVDRARELFGPGSPLLGELAAAWGGDPFLSAYWREHGPAPFRAALEDLAAKNRGATLHDFGAYLRTAVENPRSRRLAAAPPQIPNVPPPRPGPTPEERAARDAEAERQRQKLRADIDQAERDGAATDPTHPLHWTVLARRRLAAAAK